MYKTEFHETISCVGKKSEYASLLSAIVDTKYRFTYYGEKLSDKLPFGKCVSYSTLRLSISPIALKTV